MISITLICRLLYCWWNLAILNYQTNPNQPNKLKDINITKNDMKATIYMRDMSNPFSLTVVWLRLSGGDGLAIRLTRSGKVYDVTRMRWMQ